MKTWRGKLILAAIILSCGFAMHAEPTAQRQAAKRAAVAGERDWQTTRAAEASAQNARTKRTLALREERASW